MTNISEDYVSFEIAKLLKEKGFNEQIRDFYRFENNIWIHRNTYEHNYFNLGMPRWENCYSCPTLQMAMKWLREVYGLHISLEPCYDYDSMHVVFLAFVQNVADVHEFMDGRKNVASHLNAEKSYELAIKYCLENLI